MHPWLVRRAIFPLHEWIKGKRTYARLRELERTQWLDPAAVRELQFERARRHLEFAYRTVPYYRRLFDEHGVVPSRVASLEDLSRIPCLARETIRDRFDDLRARVRLRGVQRMSTGGSTGVPVTVLVDRERSAFTDAARLRSHRWFDVDVGAPEVVLWGSPIELGRQSRLRGLRDRLINSRLLSAFDLGEAALARYAAIVRDYRPLKLYGYASALVLLAAYLARSGWRPAPGWPRAVFATAEPLYDFQRVVIESTFGCPVAVEYGARDAGLIATECPAGGLHVAAEGMIVEVVGSVGDGAGEIVVTNLESLAMPLIRYRTGDVGAFEPDPCPCGRGLPRLRGVEGRRTDFLVSPSGRVMHALSVIYVLREIPEVREFQVVQERLDRLSVTVVPEDGFSERTREVIVSGVARLFDGTVDVSVEVAREIVRAPSGKHRYVVSHVADRYLGELLSVPWRARP